MLAGKPTSAMCVQKFHDSRGLAIRITYRISLRSSSLWEPRHPSLKVVGDLCHGCQHEACGAPVFFLSIFGSMLMVDEKVGSCLCWGKPTCPATPWILISFSSSKWGDFKVCRANVATTLGSNIQGSLSKRSWIGVVMILPQVHLRKPCYDFTFL
jgi:hypothetical protein